MNGRELSLDHGYPVRAVVPGHYGMASVKWLTRIFAVREPFAGYWQTADYAYWDEAGGQPVRRALGEMQVKAEIARPRMYDVLAPNRSYTVCGAAWAGESAVTEIAVSTDCGQSWAAAQWVDPLGRHAWLRWRFEWRTPARSGKYTLLARAKDAQGTAQPVQYDPKYASYVINYPLPIEVWVDDPTDASR